MQERRASAADKSPLEMASVGNKLELLLQSSYVFFKPANNYDLPI